MAHAIFISYRRDDTEGEAGRLFSDLTHAFGDDGVFMDVADIRPGADFRHVIDESVAECGVLLAVIGPTWLTIADAEGRHRLDNPNDFVGLEIGAALKRGIPVVPVLVHGAHMPPPEQLPESLRDLSFRNSVEISHARWKSDVQLLIDALQSYVTPNPATEQQPVHATVPVQLPPPHPASAAPAASAAPPKKSRKWLILGILAAIIVLFVIFWALGGFDPASSGRQQGSASPSGSPSSEPAKPAAQPLAIPPAFAGQWVDTNPRSGNSLYELDISVSGGQIVIHAWGACQPQACDWGTQIANFDGTAATATFTTESTDGETRTAVISVRPAAGNLDVSVQNTFTDSSGSRQNQVHRTFVPQS